MKKDKNRGIFSSRAFRHGSLATVFTAVFIVAIVLVNIVASAMSDRYPLTIDLTAGKDYTLSLSDEYTAYVKRVDIPVTITVCMNQTAIDSGSYASYLLSNQNVADPTPGTKYLKQMQVFTEGFAKLNRLIKVEYKDPFSLSEFSPIKAEYPDENIGFGDIIISSQFTSASGNEISRHRTLTFTDIFNVEDPMGYASYGYDSYKIAGSKLDTSIVSALYVVTSEKSIKCSVVDSRGADDASGLQTLMKQNNYEFQTMTDLLTQDIPDDSTFLILSAPSTDLSIDEINKIEAFLENGGEYGKQLLYIASIEQPALPNLEEFLYEWGIQILPETIFATESEDFYQDPSYVNTYIADNESATSSTNSNKQYTEKFDTTRSLFYPIPCRAVKTAFEDQDVYYTTRILSSSDTAVGRPLDAQSNWDAASATVKGPFDIVTLSTKYTITDDAAEMKLSNIGVISSLFFIHPEILQSSAALNGDFIVNMLNTMAGVEESGVEIVAKTISTTNFADKLLDSSMPTVIAILFIGVLPVSLIVIGLVIWFRRKNL